MMFCAQPSFLHVTLQGIPFGQRTIGFVMNSAKAGWGAGAKPCLQLRAGSEPSQVMLHTPSAQPPVHSAGQMPPYGGSAAQTPPQVV